MVLRCVEIPHCNVFLYSEYVTYAVMKNGQINFKKKRFHFFVLNETYHSDITVILFVRQISKYGKKLMKD